MQQVMETFFQQIITRHGGAGRPVPLEIHPVGGEAIKLSNGLTGNRHLFDQFRQSSILDTIQGF